MDREIIIRAQKGDSAALAQIYENMYKRVYYLALRLTKNAEDAEDVAQETFISAFAALERLEKPEAFEGWLFQICSNRCRNLLRKNAHTVELAEDEEGKTMLDDMADPNEALIPETAMENEAQRRLIMETIQALPENQRTCVFMFYYSGLGVKQIASELGCSEGTVKSRLNYARQKIKESVLEIEKRDGIRLHSFAPIGLLLLADFNAVSAGISIPALGAAGAAAVGAAGGSAAAATAAGTAKVTAGVALKTKIIAGVAAAAVAAGGGIAAYQATRTEAPAPSAEYVEFADANMEHNMHILLDVPMEEPIEKSAMAEIDAVFFIDGGMNLLTEDWTEGWLTEDGGFSDAPGAYSYPLYSVARMCPAEGTLPVQDLSDLQYFGEEAVWIGCLDAQTELNLAVLETLFPECVLREQATGGVKAPFYGSVYWDDSGEVRVNSEAALRSLRSYAIIRAAEAADFEDPAMEHNMHILLELPQDVPITRYELGLIRQIEFYDGHMNFFNGHCWFQGSGYEDTRPVSSYADLKLLNKQNLIVTADLPGSVDEASILEICPHAEFHYFSE